MKPTTLLLLLSLSVAVHSRLISGTVNLTKDTTGINFVNDTIQLVTNDTCKYPDCKRVYYCGDTSAPDLFFTPLELGETQQYQYMRFYIGSHNPIYGSGGYRTNNLDSLKLDDPDKFSKFDTNRTTDSQCILPISDGGLFSPQADRPIFVLQSRKGQFAICKWKPYYTMLSWDPVSGKTLYYCYGITIDWWLQTNGKPEFPELSKTKIKIQEIKKNMPKKLKQITYYNIQGQRIATNKLSALSGIQVLVADHHCVINILNKNR